MRECQTELPQICFDDNLEVVIIAISIIVAIQYAKVGFLLVHIKVIILHVNLIINLINVNVNDDH